MGLKLVQSLVGHSHNFCPTFTPAHLVGRTNCILKGMWLGWCPNISTGNENSSITSLEELVKCFLLPEGPPEWMGLMHVSFTGPVMPAHTCRHLQ
uniref:Uncharacterized protein n=1 Tax=Peromyscus maniculatus bairdii TaxID=230844 RepID=A0A8C8W8D4_PERMB